MVPDCLKRECIINEEDWNKLLTISTCNVERECCANDKRRIKTSRVVTICRKVLARVSKRWLRHWMGDLLSTISTDQRLWRTRLDERTLGSRKWQDHQLERWCSQGQRRSYHPGKRWSIRMISDVRTWNFDTDVMVSCRIGWCRWDWCRSATRGGRSAILSDSQLREE